MTDVNNQADAGSDGFKIVLRDGGKSFCVVKDSETGGKNRFVKLDKNSVVCVLVAEGGVIPKECIAPLHPRALDSIWNNRILNTVDGELVKFLSDRENKFVVDDIINYIDNRIDYFCRINDNYNSNKYKRLIRAFKELYDNKSKG